MRSKHSVRTRGHRSGKKQSPPTIVYLVGFTGSGKSIVGRLLAIRTGTRFIDLDQEISRKAGMAISKLFGRLGEEGFRELESTLLHTLTQTVGAGEGLVVATGGGVVERVENIRIMRRSGLVCYLRTTYDEILRRLGDDQPGQQLWQDKEELRRRYELRSPLYEKAAHWSVDTDGRDPAQIVLELIAEMNRRGRPLSSNQGAGRRSRC